MRIQLIFCLAVSLLAFAAVSLAERSETVALLNAPSKLDPVSAQCYSCHDGSGGPHARFCLLEQMGRGCGGHLVSASYAELAARNRNLHSPSELPSELVFYEGRITCVTCHGSEPHSGVPLAMDNTGSALCRACHLK